MTASKCTLGITNATLKKCATGERKKVGCKKIAKTHTHTKCWGMDFVEQKIDTHIKKIVIFSDARKQKVDRNRNFIAEWIYSDFQEKFFEIIIGRHFSSITKHRVYTKSCLHTKKCTAKAHWQFGLVDRGEQEIFDGINILYLRHGAHWSHSKNKKRKKKHSQPAKTQTHTHAHFRLSATKKLPSETTIRMKYVYYNCERETERTCERRNGGESERSWNTTMREKMKWMHIVRYLSAF